MFEVRWRAVTFRVPILSVPRWRCVLGHRWSGWFESLGRYAIGRRHRQCLRCGKLETGQ